MRVHLIICGFFFFSGIFYCICSLLSIANNQLIWTIFNGHIAIMGKMDGLKLNYYNLHDVFEGIISSGNEKG